MSDANAVTGVAGRYAKALFELADESNQLELVEGHLNTIAAALRESADLRALTASPVYSREQQGAAMAALCAAMGVGAPTSGLVGLMAQKRRLFELGGVIAGFNALLARRRGVVSAAVTSALPLSAAQRDALQRTLAQATGARIALTETVDEALIGGLVVRVGSKMIDTSIRSKLSQVQTMMKEAGI